MLLKPGVTGSVLPERLEQTSRTVLMAVEMVIYIVARQQWEKTYEQLNALIPAAESLHTHMSERSTDAEPSIDLRPATNITEATHNLRTAGGVMEQNLSNGLNYARTLGDLKGLIDAAATLRDFVEDRFDVESTQ